MKTNKVNSERRHFFRKAGLGAVGAGLFSAMPFNLFSRPKETKEPEQNISIPIKIDPMAVKREKRK